jgi:GNAT superfamily N-acetyltransferase
MTQPFLDDSILLKSKITTAYLSKSNIDLTSDFIIRHPSSLRKNDLVSHCLTLNDRCAYRYAFIAIIKKDVVGVILFTDLEDQIFINHLYVAPIHRFKGIGSALLSKVKTFAGDNRVTLNDASNNYMPWMQHIDNHSKKSQQINRLGSFYKS